MLLSVIIPMYNAENYIRRCVESLYQQNIMDSDFEVIIINDGSIDQSYQQACILSKEHASATPLGPCMAIVPTSIRIPLGPSEQQHAGIP